MSGATSTVSAAPAAPAAPVTADARPTGADQAAQTSASGTPGQSFTEVLSAQRAHSPHDGEDRHDTGAKRDPSHGEGTGSAKGGRPSSSADPGHTPAGAPVAASPPTEQAVSLAPAVADTADPADPADPTGPSTPAPGSGAAVQEPELTAGPMHATHAQLATLATTSASTSPVASADAPGATDASGTGATDAGLPGAASTADTQAVAAPDPGDSAGDGSDGAAVSASPPAAVGPLLGSTPSRSTAAGLPTHDGEAGAPAAVATRVASLPEASGVPSSPPPTAPLPHLAPLSPPGQPGSPRTGAVPSVGGSAAASAPTMAQQAASALDVDDLSASISRPLSDGNGNYTVTVALHPPALGHVEAVLSLDGNDLSVALTAQTQSGHDAVANATEALRDQLARGGVNVNVTLRDPGSQAGGDERYRPPTPTGTAGALMTEGAAAETPLSSGLVSGQIHLVL
jgi:flagellar hook-length control protein FliK